MDEKDLSLEQMISGLEGLDESELLSLDRALKRRIDLLRQASLSESFKRFSVGDNVQFENKENAIVQGKIIKINKKTLSIISDSTERWNVSPELVQHVSADVVATISHTKTEWIGGVDLMKGHVSEGDNSYQPSVIMWMDTEGVILGSDLCKLDGLAPQVISSLRNAIENPLIKGAASPQRIRLNDAALVNALKQEFPSIEFHTAPTPELDEAFESLNEHMGLNSVAPLNWLNNQIPPEAIARLFTATAALYRIKPWRLIHDDSFVIGVDCEAHNLSDAVVSVIGQGGEEFGFILFYSIADYQKFSAAADAMQLGVLVDFPSHIALNFIPGSDIEHSVRKHIASHSWEVANARAYPDIFIPEINRTLRPASITDLDLVEGLSRALTDIMKNEKAFKKAAMRSQGINTTVTATTYVGELDIRLKLPFSFDLASEQFYGESSIMHRLYCMSGQGGSADFDGFLALAEQLDEEFHHSKFGQPFATQLCAAKLIHEFAFNYFDQTIATLNPLELSDTILDIVPRKFMCEVEDAEQILKSIDAFFEFLHHQYRLPSAAACQKFIRTEWLLEELQDALSDSSNFGLAKSVFSGSYLDDPTHFDTSQFAQSMFDESVNVQTPVLTEKQRAAQKKSRKKKRKASRKSRKKNK